MLCHRCGAEVSDRIKFSNQMNTGEIPYVEHSIGQIIIFVLMTLAIFVISFVLGFPMAGF
ncbi:MAG: hypothetical protein BWY45_03320 [Euryarchaeota archaeon ADurb.Bin294]|nr:MAG: hypothetical protein BWY45_03320 [Euryarchaeota archaeon ADurb.Bin294]